KGAYDYIVKKGGYERLLPTVVAKAVERHHLKTKLAQSEERYQRLVECASDAICLSGLDGRVIMINQQIEAITGCPPARLIGEPLIQLLSKEDHPQFQRAFRDVCDGSRISSEYQILHKELGTRWVSVSGGPLLEKNKVSGGIFIFRDISDQKLAETALMRKNK